jgi:exonuclease SbcD
VKLIHLADLHLGKRAHEVSMMEDQRVMLDSAIDLCRRERPDVVIIAGDVYDKPIPSVEAINLFEAFLLALSALDVTVLIIAGNHDSGERLSFGDAFFRKEGIHIAGVFDGALDEVILSDEHGDVVFYLLPFIRPMHVRRFFPEEEILSTEDAVRCVLRSVGKSASTSTLGDAVCVVDASIKEIAHSTNEGASRRVFCSAGKNASTRHVLVAHQFVTRSGAAVIRSDSETLQVGTTDQVDVSLFSAFDYVALGHLHGSQSLTECVWYAGSPLAYSFSEIGQEKGALVVEIGSDGSPVVRQESLAYLHAMRRIRGTLDELLSDGKALERRSDPSREDYLEVTLTDRGPVADPMNRLKVYYPNIMRLIFERVRDETDHRDALVDSDDLGKLDPAALFARFFELQTGRPLSELEQRIVADAAKSASDAYDVNIDSASVSLENDIGDSDEVDGDTAVTLVTFAEGISDDSISGNANISSLTHRRESERTFRDLSYERSDDGTPGGGAR